MHDKTYEAAAAIPDNPGYPHDYSQPCSCTECRFTAVEGAYSGTSDDVLGRWYIVDRDADIIDKRGRGYATKADALTAAAFNLAEDERITAAMRDRYPTLLDGVAPHIPGTDYYDGRDGSIEAEDDDEDRIEAEDEARREEWSEFLEWQRSLGA